MGFNQRISRTVVIVNQVVEGAVGERKIGLPGECGG